MAGVLDPDKLLDVASGLAVVKVEPMTTAAVTPEQTFTAMEQQRRSRQLSQTVSGASLRYQASKAQPGLLEGSQASACQRQPDLAEPSVPKNRESDFAPR